jgi:hypothetical protein
VKYGAKPGASRHCQPPRCGRISKIVITGDSLSERSRGCRAALLRGCTESETAYRDRLGEQGAYFGITREQAAQLGKEAAAFTFKALAEPFTVQTRCDSTSGAECSC